MILGYDIVIGVKFNSIFSFHFLPFLANSEGNVREWEEKRRKEMEGHHEH